jgi:hypothetical protein
MMEKRVSPLSIAFVCGDAKPRTYTGDAEYRFAKVARSAEGFLRTECNRILGRAGQAFWQDESYDHLVRSELEFGRIQRYIEQNPVTAGLALTAEQFPWSSAFLAENAA